MAKTAPDTVGPDGHEQHRTVPRAAHAKWSPGPDRADPVALLEGQATSRVAALVPIRYGRMSTSPFAFYRGAAAIMAADLATVPRTNITAQLCGDAHLVNFGGYATPERNLVFDVNDFDETLPGPFEWDIKRLGASFVVAGRANGFAADASRNAVLAMIASYRQAMDQASRSTNLTNWYMQMTSEMIQSALPRSQGKRFAAKVSQVTTEDPERSVDKLIERYRGKLRIKENRPLILRLGSLPGVDTKTLRSEVFESVQKYRRTLPLDRRTLLDRYEPLDIAHKVVGVGSVGLRAFIVLMRGRSDNDLFFLQVKEAQASVLEQYVGRSQFASHGERVVQGQKLMQASGDIFMGWLSSSTSSNFYVRQLRDWKVGVDIASLSPKGLAVYGRACGWALARAQARSVDPSLISTYMGPRSERFDTAIADFAEAYANQNELDFNAFKDAIKQGRITAQLGV